MIFLSTSLYAQGNDYTPPTISNPHGATITWQSDGSVIVEGGPVEFITGIHKRTFNASEHIFANEMLLVNKETYIAGKDKNIIYGINSKDLNSNGAVQLEVYNRPHTLQGIPSLINSPPNFGYDFTNNNFMIYGAKTGDSFNQEFKNEEESWDAYGYYASGWSFSESQILSTDIKHLYNRPKSATWWDTAFDVEAVALVVAGIVLTAGFANFAVLAPSIFGSEAIFNYATLLGLSGVYVLSVGTFLAYHAATSPNINLAPQFKYQTNGEIPLPEKIANPINANQKDFNKAIDAYLTHAEDCSFIPNKKCITMPIMPAVAKMTVKDAHVKFVTIPGAVHKNLTPYQLFGQYYYVTDDGAIDATPEHQTLVIKEASEIFSDVSLLPKKIIQSTVEQSVTLEYENYNSFPFLYFVSTIESFNLHESYSQNLGPYGKLSTGSQPPEQYYLYRYQVQSPETESGKPSIDITLGPDGPYLAGDNFVIKAPTNPSNVLVKVTKPDGSVRGSYAFSSLAEVAPETVQCIMGDKVEFTVITSNSEPPAGITGLPATWLAPTGREYYYHCDPSIVPGAIKPKIPFDVQSHYVSSNDATVENYPEWVQDLSNNNSYKFTWIAQRRTSVVPTNGNTKYKAQFKFLKADILGRKLQRRSKSEGQIMDFLEIYNKGKTPSLAAEGGHTYNPSEKKFYWNIDSDELIYLNTKDYNTNTPGWNGKVKRVPVYDVAESNDPYSTPSLALPAQVSSGVGKLYEPWQLVREGDYIWNKEDGYPESGFLINSLVDAYRQHHDKTTPLYRGYEIEDFCLYKDKNGNCIEASSINYLGGLNAA